MELGSGSANTIYGSFCTRVVKDEELFLDLLKIDNNINNITSNSNPATVVEVPSHHNNILKIVLQRWPQYSLHFLKLLQNN